MTTATLNLYGVQKNIHDKIKSIDLPVINWKAFCFIGCFISLALLVFYVCQINDLTRGSYIISSYEKQISKLSEENKGLQVSFAESSFLGQALEKIKVLNFQKVTTVKYIKISNSSVQVAETKKGI